MRMNAETYLFRVVRAFADPVPAEVENVVVLRPSHPDRKVVVMRLFDDGWAPVHVRGECSEAIRDRIAAGDLELIPCPVPQQAARSA